MKHIINNKLKMLNGQVIQATIRRTKSMPNYERLYKKLKMYIQQCATIVTTRTE